MAGEGEPEAVHGQIRFALPDGAAAVDDQGRQPAGGHDQRCRPERGDELGGDPGDQPVDQPGEPEHQPRLQRGDGVLPDRVRRHGELHRSQLRRPRREGLEADLDARRQRTAEELPVGADRVDVCGRAEVDDDDGRPRPSLDRPNSSCAASAVTTRSAPTSRGLSTCSGTPVRTPGPMSTTGTSRESSTWRSAGRSAGTVEHAATPVTSVSRSRPRQRTAARRRWPGPTW